MRVIFAGTPDFATIILKHLLETKHNIIAIITNPDKPRSRRGKKCLPTPVKIVAEEYNILCLQPQKPNKDKEFKAKLKELEPDIIITAAYGCILCRSLLNLPSLGCINIHASLLPYYRGAAPINWAIMNGETETGISIFYMVRKCDAGDIILQKKLEISSNENVLELTERLAYLSCETIVETLQLIATGKVICTPQDETQATYAPKLDKEITLINWEKSIKSLYNHIRGLSPIPSAYTFFRGEQLKIFASEIIEEYETSEEVNTGEIKEIRKNGPVILCNDGLLLLTSVQLPSKKRISGGDFVRGTRVTIGEKLG